jgi:hypothetical protein
LVHWSLVPTLSPKILGSSPTLLKKEEKKSGEQKPESIFARIQFGINIRNFGKFTRNFQGPKLRV